MIKLTVSYSQLLALSILLRVGFFLFGLYQDANMPVKYTDIDYLVFSDAARYVSQGLSPYNRETYRYTPLLAWILIPTAWGGLYVHFGKILFMICDVLTGILISKSLPALINETRRAFLLALWLLNPMVITISTRGSSESLLTCFIMLSVYYFLRNHYKLSAFWLGLSIHLKIYPIIYIPTFLYYLTAHGRPIELLARFPIANWFTVTKLTYLLVTIASFSACNVLMYHYYGFEFLEHSYLYHLTRIDHRHNFSVYNVMIYYASARPYLLNVRETILGTFLARIAGQIEHFAFWPQLLVSAGIVPLILAQKHLTACLFIQTFAFVAFNKVVTSQYFIWFTIFLPHYFATSSLLSNEKKFRGVMMLILWVASQVVWLFYAYRLEFLGESTFASGLLASSLMFFIMNCYLLKQFIELA
ncbi:hypothetical protein METBISCDRAFT_16034 [Metschnikowia bicuspidata]|uniref:GPI mannosyltransferase 1 n=1 Tax=Metschnikowia bicuspidata TaxID=27322 RepID=A0A4P9ZCD3_9ASCO|nr:hypothetical protein METBISCDRAFT_16034 [Metschnikowia bicuspidata]